MSRANMGAALGCDRGRGCGYVGSFVLLTMVLRAGMPVGVAYGVWTACGVALTRVMATGIALIMAGVLTIEMGGAVN